MKHKLFIGSVLSALALGGCYVDSGEERMPLAPGGSTFTPAPDDSGSSCRKRLSKGCLVGYVAASKIFVESEEFFDARDFSYRFPEIVAVSVQEGNDQSVLNLDKDYELSLLTAVDNRTFAKNFEVYLTGEDARTTRVPMSGEFVMDELPEGRYEVRVQKALKFEVKRTIPVIDENPDDEISPDPRVEKTVHCATLYTDVPLEIRKGEVTRIEFQDFDLHTTNRSCDEERGRAEIAISN